MVRLLEIFTQRYTGQHVYIASDLLLYYVEGTPTKYVVPDPTELLRHLDSLHGDLNIITVLRFPAADGCVCSVR